MPLNDDDFMRYSRHLLMDDIGESGQEKLINSRILIVGLGGLGCPVSIYLAGAGVGFLTLCDPDRVDKTNLQRQVLFRSEDCGEFKVSCAKDRLKALNDNVNIEIYPRAVDTEILNYHYDLIIDCTDNLPARHMLNKQCSDKKIPFVSAAAVGWEGQLIGFDFNNYSSPCFNCVINGQLQEPVMNCANSGVVGPVLGVIGSLQATIAIRILLGYFQQHGEMQRYDGKRGQWLTMTSMRDKACMVCSHEL